MLIDLTLPLNENSPVYPGDPNVKIDPFLSIEKDGCSVHSLCIATHTATHIDAPSHMIKNGKSLDQFPLDTFTGKGVCIDVSNGFDLYDIKKTEINLGDIILFYSGWDKHAYKDDYYLNHPLITLEIAKYLVAKKIKMVGIDFPTPDKELFLVHKLLLQNDILILESLRNLNEVVNKKFTLFAFPLNLSLDGSPVRVVAQFT